MSNAGESSITPTGDITPSLENQTPHPTLVEDVRHSQSQNLQASSERQIGIVAEPFVELTSRLTRDTLPTASVKFPDSEELTVQLVNISQLQRLDELQGDVALLQTILFTVIGTVLGFVTNLFTSNQAIDKSTWIFLTVLLTCSILFGVLTIRASRRASELRKRLFDDTPKHTD